MQTGQFNGVPEHDNAADFGFAVDSLKVTDRPLHFGDQVVEDRPHRLEDHLGIFRLPRVSFQVFGLGESQLQFFGQLFGKVVTAQRHTALPDSEPVGDYQVRRVGAHREDDQGGRWVVGIIINRGNLLA